jgi:hypothetical protein
VLHWASVGCEVLNAVFCRWIGRTWLMDDAKQ